MTLSQWLCHVNICFGGSKKTTKNFGQNTDNDTKVWTRNLWSTILLFMMIGFLDFVHRLVFWMEHNNMWSSDGDQIFLVDPTE
jgi:hypothetical protein